MKGPWLTSVSVAGEVAGVLDVGGALEVTAGDGVAADGGDDGGVGEGGLGGDDGVGDVVVDGLKLLRLAKVFPLAWFVRMTETKQLHCSNRSFP